MPPSEAQKATEEMARRLAALDRDAAQEIIDAYQPTEENIRKRVAQIISLAQKRKLPPWQIARMTAMTTLKAQVIGELAIYQSIVNGIITSRQAGAVALSAQGTPMIANAALPQGITLDMLDNIGIRWNMLPAEAFNSFVGISGDGKPVGELLSRYGPENATKITAEIRSGIVSGKGPRAVAKQAQKATGVPLSQALTISRTEINRAHRESTRLNYAANSNIVKGYRRVATKDATTCVACIALDGTAYETNEPLDSHPNCRCAMVPATLQYSDLGLDIPDAPQPPGAQDWFNNQSATTQQKMLGTKKYDALKQGKISLSDVVTTKSNSVWGKSSSVISDKALGL